MPRKASRARDGEWPRPSARVRELLAKGAELVLRSPPEWLVELDERSLASVAMQPIAADPVLAAAIRRTSRANLVHWAAANVRDPGAPVAPNVGAAMLEVSREMVRRGVSGFALDAYRTGQNAAWLRWMEIAFALTSDPHELHELLDVTARSIAAFIDATIAAVAAHMDAERDELTGGTHAERRETVALVLGGAPITAASASQRLGYPLDGPHLAAIIWCDAADSELGRLERAADAFVRALDPTASPSGDASRSARRALDPTASPSGDASRSARRALDPTPSPSGDASRSARRALDPTASPSGDASRSARRALDPTPSPFGDASRSARRALDPTASPFGDASRSARRALGSPRALTVIASAATLWVWAASTAAPDARALRAALDRLPGVQLAIGSRARGVEGFRRSHFDAVSTQRMLARIRSGARLATFDDIRLVSLVTADADAAQELVAHVLGDLATAPAELRVALRTFLAEGCNASQTAKLLRTHRNTLLRRLARAEALLPRPLAAHRLDVAAALEVERWRGDSRDTLRA